MAQTEYKSDIEIAREANMRPVIEMAKERFGIPAEHLDPYGHYKAKLSLDQSDITRRPGANLSVRDDPTAAGKQTHTVGWRWLTDGKTRQFVCANRPLVLFRDEGWCSWRWLCTGRSDGGN